MAEKRPGGDSEGLHTLEVLSEVRGRPKGRTKRQPYASKIPNDASLEAIEQTRTREGLISYDSVDEMMADLFGDE